MAQATCGFLQSRTMEFTQGLLYPGLRLSWRSVLLYQVTPMGHVRWALCELGVLPHAGPWKSP